KGCDDEPRQVATSGGAPHEAVEGTEPSVTAVSDNHLSYRDMRKELQTMDTELGQMLDNARLMDVKVGVLVADMSSGIETTDLLRNMCRAMATEADISGRLKAANDGQKLMAEIPKK
ncbi:unnamed protein product, partial [Medioppia subpectinata]